MINRVTDINNLSGVSSPLLPLIYGDFDFSVNDTDGAYIQYDTQGEMLCAFSLKNGSATVLKSGNVNVEELEAFFGFLDVCDVISDFPFGFQNEKALPVLSLNNLSGKNTLTRILTSESTLNEYSEIYDLLNKDSDNFPQWYSVFSKKINNSKAVAAYKCVDGKAVSTAVSTAVYGENAVISGVFTHREYRHKGFASECVLSVLNELNKLNTESAFLWCENDKTDFYKKLGFSSAGQVYIRKEI
ncbi:MAG: GNAT family N-acetyltransferase [Clostridia bacterium]|nr:GNAT family N-acetyltransferase [Clostridia bacterium]